MTHEEALKVAKPILFNTEMVRAIQGGTKTITRRVLKNQDPERAFNYDYVNDTDGIAREVDLICDMGNNVLEAMVNKIPYFVGDILYVRETWCKGKFRGEEEQYYYRADNKIPHCEWHPSIHMPKEAARIFLRVANVRVERLQDITEEQAIHEGIDPHMLLSNRAGTITEYRIPGTCDECPTAWGAFIHLWNSTVKKSDLAKYGWAANPWVWVIEFERIEVE